MLIWRVSICTNLRVSVLCTQAGGGAVDRNVSPLTSPLASSRHDWGAQDVLLDPQAYSAMLLDGVGWLSPPFPGALNTGIVS